MRGFGMNWVRTHIRNGSKLALFALAIQMVLAFGHFHAVHAQATPGFSIERAHSGDALLVPAAAVIHEGDDARVWVVRPDGLLVARTVTAGEEQDGKVAITAGLKPGERIVTAGALFVNEAGFGE